MSQRSVSIVHIAQYLANYARDQRLQIIEEVGILLADYEIDTGQTYPGMFAKLSKVRSRLSAPAEPAKENRT
jgi:hypothetical protein